MILVCNQDSKSDDTISFKYFVLHKNLYKLSFLNYIKARDSMCNPNHKYYLYNVYKTHLFIEANESLVASRL